ncbi:YbaY family lipoprotein [Reyranella sp.]|mgnify:CR=1 FL=1|uniref:YbaY family lipoprotein n=1 Tax=Reyranella sp. TaxID=1929291 RepID=UPI004036DE26
MTTIHRLLPVLLAACIAAPALAAPDGGISTPMLSRCAGKAGLETRQSDAAFGLLTLDGVPWLSIERTDEAVGIQPIMTTVTGTGSRHRRNGTSVPFRFTCVLDANGQALMFHASLLMPKLGDTLPPATVISGTATLAEKTAMPRGVELQIQLFDIARSAEGELLAEQVVRSGWQIPIPFALRLPGNFSAEGRKLALTARLVAAHQIQYRLPALRLLTDREIPGPVVLMLEKPN